jgi:periplasmic divalent cation tolerance protein
MQTVWIGWTTLDSAEAAETLARGAVEAGLAACGQVEGPIRSFYRWDGRLENSREWRVAFKFPSGNAERLAAWIKAHHPYEVPQWVAVEAAKTLPSYESWVVSGAGA